MAFLGGLFMFVFVVAFFAMIYFGIRSFINKIRKSDNNYSKQIYISIAAAVVSLFLGATFISKGQSSNGDNKPASASDRNVYEVKISDVKVNDNADWLISGTTIAPDDTRIMVTPTKSSRNYGENIGVASSEGELATVENGKFKVYANYSNLTDQNELKPGQKVKATIFAIGGNTKKDETYYIEPAALKVARKKFNPVKLTVTNKIVADIDKNKAEEKSESDTSSSEESKSDSSSSSSSSEKSSSKSSSKDDSDYSAVNDLIVDRLAEDQGFAKGTLDENGKPTDNGTPNSNFDWSLYVTGIDVRGSNDVYVSVNSAFEALNEEAKNDVAIKAQNVAVACLLEKEQISDEDSISGLMTWIKNGDTTYGRSTILNAKKFKWYK